MPWFAKIRAVKTEAALVIIFNSEKYDIYNNIKMRTVFRPQPIFLGFEYRLRHIGNR